MLHILIKNTHISHPSHFSPTTHQLQLHVFLVLFYPLSMTMCAWNYQNMDNTRVTPSLKKTNSLFSSSNHWSIARQWVVELHESLFHLAEILSGLVLCRFYECGHIQSPAIHITHLVCSCFFVFLGEFVYNLPQIHSANILLMQNKFSFAQNLFT